MLCWRAAMWLVALLGVVQPGRIDELSAEARQLQGSWRLVRLDRGGQPVAGAFRADAHVVVDGDSLCFTVGRDQLFKLRFLLDPSTSPKEIDLIAESGPVPGKLLRGLYSLQGNRLTLCWPLDEDAARPTELSPNGGRDVTTLVLMRE